jgi:hypothetical protein
MSPLRGDIAQDQKRPRKQPQAKLQARDIKRIQTDAKSALLILGVLGDFVAENRGADFVKYLVPSLRARIG